MLEQVPNDDPMLGNGTSAPDGDLELDEDAELTEEQIEKRKEAEESFKVIKACLGWSSIVAKQDSPHAKSSKSTRSYLSMVKQFAVGHNPDLQDTAIF